MPQGKTWMAGSSPATGIQDYALTIASSPDRVLVPRAPALVAGFREILWLSPEGEIEALSPVEARARLEGEAAMVCHARAVARRLDLAGFAALDLLELFAFVRPAQFCVPTPRGLAAALGLAPPGNMAEACVALATAARALLQQLQAESEPDIRIIAEAAANAGWAWGPAVLAALPPGEPGAMRRANGLRVWQNLAEWQERPPPPPPGNAPVSAADARGRLAALLGDGAEARPQQADYAAAVAAAFAPRDRPDTPRAVLAEAGTGVGKTLGYIAPASLWAERNQGAVWISTFTRNLQSQIAGELDRLYPEPVQKRRRVVVRKGRESFLCLLNYEEAVRAARHPRLCDANPGLVMAQAALGGLDDASVPTRYVFDEGHHLLEAADAAFAVRLSGQEGRELRRWILGAEAGRSRARRLQRRIGDLVEADEEASRALLETLVAARILPADGWHQRVAEDRGLPGSEGFLTLVRRQILARTAQSDSGYGVEAELRPPIDGLVEAGDRKSVV